MLWFWWYSSQAKNPAIMNGASSTTWSTMMSTSSCRISVKVMAASTMDARVPARRPPRCAAATSVCSAALSRIPSRLSDRGRHELDVKALRAVPLFAGLGKRDLEEVSRLADEVDVADGEVLARQGDIGHEFFVIEQGSASVERDGERIADLGPGAFFGELALVSEDARRTATVTATSPMTLMVLTGSSFRSLARNQPKVFETVQAEIARRRPAPA